MTRSLLPLLALLVAAPLAAQPLVVSKTDDGFRTAAATAEPVGDAPSALVSLSPSGAWTLRTLSPGDVPTQAHRQMDAAFEVMRERRLTPPAPPEPPTAPPAPTLPDVLEALDARPLQARYTVRSTVAPDAADALLVALAEMDALEGLEASTFDEGVSVEVVFTFDSVAAWSAWKASAETAAALTPLMGGDVRTTLQAR